MDIVASPRGEPMRCLREDVASDSLVEVWVMSYRGLLHEARGAAPGGGANPRPNPNPEKIHQDQSGKSDS